MGCVIFYKAFDRSEVGDEIPYAITNFAFCSRSEWNEFQKFKNKYWSTSLSKISNRANIWNKWKELHSEKPYFPLLSNGELDIEALKLKCKKEEKERYEARLKEEEERKEQDRKFENSFCGKLIIFISKFLDILSK